MDNPGFRMWTIAISFEEEAVDEAHRCSIQGSGRKKKGKISGEKLIGKGEAETEEAER
jgi:hypothetical protein